MPTPDQLVEEFQQTLLSTQEFIKEGIRREASPVQTKIVLNQKMDEIVESLNKFLFELDHSADVKVSTIVEALPVITDILNHIPKTNLFEHTWHKYSALSNFLRMNIANFNLESDHVRIITSANLLGQLLIGDVPKVEKLPEMPSFSDPTRYFETFATIYNTLQSTVGVYQSLMDTLTTITYVDLIKWAEEGLWHFKLLLDLLFSVDHLALLESRKVKKMSRFFENQYNSTVQYIGILDFLLTLDLKFAQMWPKNLDGHGIVEDFTISGFLQLTEKLEARVMKIETDLMQAYDSHLIDRNDHPQQTEHYEILTLIKTTFHQIKCELDLFQKSELTNDLQQLNEFISLNLEVIDDFIAKTGGVERLMESYFLTAVLGTFKFVIPALAHEAVLLGSREKFENIRFKYRAVLDQIDPSIDSSLFLTNIFAKLYIHSHLGHELKCEQYIDQLNTARIHLLMKPRDYIAATILILILTILKAPESYDQHEILMNEIISYGIDEGMQQHLRDEIMGYLEQIRLVTRGEPADFGEYMYRLQYVAMDNSTWLIPDFSSYCQQLGLHPLTYVPFNRECDSIIK